MLETSKDKDGTKSTIEIHKESLRERTCQVDHQSKDAPLPSLLRFVLLARTPAFSVHKEKRKFISADFQLIKARTERCVEQWGLTDKRSSPASSRFGTAVERLNGFHCGYSCQSLSVLTPGHTSSFGVPSNLNFHSKKKETE